MWDNWPPTSWKQSLAVCNMMFMEFFQKETKDPRVWVCSCMCIWIPVSLHMCGCEFIFVAVCVVMVVALDKFVNKVLNIFIGSFFKIMVLAVSSFLGFVSLWGIVLVCLFLWECRSVSLVCVYGGVPLFVCLVCVWGDSEWSFVCVCVSVCVCVWRWVGMMWLSLCVLWGVAIVGLYECTRWRSVSWRNGGPFSIKGNYEEWGLFQSRKLCQKQHGHPRLPYWRPKERISIDAVTLIILTQPHRPMNLTFPVRITLQKLYLWMLAVHELDPPTPEVWSYRLMSPYRFFVCPSLQGLSSTLIISFFGPTTLGDRSFRLRAMSVRKSVYLEFSTKSALTIFIIFHLKLHFDSMHNVTKLDFPKKNGKGWKIQEIPSK